MMAQILALIAVALAFRGSYLQKKAETDTQSQSAKLLTLWAIILTIGAFVVRSYDV